MNNNVTIIYLNNILNKVCIKYFIYYIIYDMIIMKYNNILTINFNIVLSYHIESHHNILTQFLDKIVYCDITKIKSKKMKAISR